MKVLTKQNLISALLLFSANIVSGAKILGIFPAPSRSHYNLYNPLMTQLAVKGHEITVISPYENRNPSKNASYREILLNGFTKISQDKSSGFHPFDTVNNNSFVTVGYVAAMLNDLTERTLADENVQKLINSKEKFDLVIITEVLNRAHRALATHFGGSLVLFSTLGANAWIHPSVGNPAPPSYVPDFFLGYSGQLTFFERVMNSCMFLFHHFLFHFYMYEAQNNMIQKYIPNGPKLDQVLYNVSLVLLNSHPSINQPIPMVPNMIEIGGFHIKPPEKLPDDLQEFLDDATDGAIYFSLGSNVRSSQLPIDKRKVFLKTFAKLKQKVLWKWEEDVLVGQPPNVKLSKWFPQQDILAHPNIKLFITHGGLLSITETVNHGVPVLAIPIFADQMLNAKTAVNNGIGLALDFGAINEKVLTETMKELLDNSTYYNNARARSRIFNDRLVSPMETAVYWIEYVIRHRGASHLRVAALDIPWYKYFLLDVISVVIVIILAVTIVLYKLAKFVTRKFCCRRTSGSKLKMN